MIVKIKSRKNQTYRQLLEYMLHDNDRLAGKEGFVVAHNLKGNRIDSWVDQLKALETGRVHRRKNSVTMTHEILSWHADDAKHMSMEKMERMTREYIRMRGVRGAKVLAIPHYNKSHYHVHLLVSGVDAAGKAMRLSREELHELKKRAQQYQIEKFPELSNSLPAHGRRSKERKTDKEVQFKKRKGKMSEREAVTVLVRSCHSQATSENDFYERLEKNGLKTYLRGGKVYGVERNGKKYRFKTMGMDLEFEHTIDFAREIEGLRKRNLRGKGRHK
jgi:hypothetical protein